MFTSKTRAGIISAAVESLPSRLLLSAGSPDPTFGAGGIVRLPSQPASGVDVLTQQPDGKIVAVGDDYAFTQDNYNLYLARYQTNGHLDTSFGTGGRVFTAPPKGQVQYPYSATVTADGKILVLAERISADEHRLASQVLLRYTSSGKLDSTFGKSGVLTIPVPTGAPTVAWEHVAVLSNGKMLVAGDTDEAAAGSDLAVMRLNSSGTVDGSFASSSHNVATADLGFDDLLKSLLVQSDGRIVLAGTDFSPHQTTSNFVAARFTTSGVLDSSFGQSGEATLISGELGSAALGVNGAVVLAGSTSDGVSVERLTSNGSVDSTFGNDGTSSFDLNSRVLAVGVDSDGKVLIGATGFTAARLNSDGTLDKNFSNDGKNSVQIGYQSPGQPTALVQSDGKVVIGDAEFIIGAVLVRFNIAGAKDSGFGNKGIACDDPNGKLGSFSSVQVQSDGKILAAGATPSVSGTSDVFLARFNANGSNDKTFGGGDGRVVIDLGGEDSVSNVHIGSDGKILLLAHRYPYGVEFLLRFNRDGSLDHTFDNDGILSNLPFDVSDVAIQSNGKIVLAGNNPDSGYWAVARLNSSGSVDHGFAQNGVSGISATGFGAGSASTLLIQPNGKIVVGGFATDYLGNVYTDYTALVRYNSNGSLDTAFGKKGVSVGSALNPQEITSLALAPDGKIVAGALGWPSIYEFFEEFPATATIDRFNANGSIDKSFGKGGVMTLDSQYQCSVDVAVQSDGKVVATGVTKEYPDDGDQFNNAFLLRLRSNGSMDTSFGSKGIVDDIDPAGDVIDLALQPDHKIVLAGSDGVLRRFLNA